MNNLVFFTVFEIFLMFLLLCLSFLGLFLYNKDLYFVSIIILFFLKKKRNVSLFSPEFALLISYMAFFILPFYFYQGGILQNDMSSIWAMMESFKLFLIMELVSVSFFFNAFSNKKILLYTRSVVCNISYKRLVFVSSIAILLRIVFFLMGYKSNAVSSLGKSSVIDVVYIPIYQGSLLLFFLSMWFIFVEKKSSLFLKIQAFLFLVLDILYLSKGRLLIDFIIILFIYYINNKKISIKLLLFLIFSMLFYLPIAQYVRFKHAGVLDMTFWKFLSIVYFNLKDLLFLLLGRLNMVEPFSRLLNLDFDGFLNNYPLHNTFFPLLLISFVPKFIWPNRLDSSIGGMVGYYLGYINSPDITQVTISILGEFYLNFKSMALLAVGLYAFYINFVYYFLLSRWNNKIVFLFLGILFYVFNILTGFESYFVVRNVIFLKLASIYYIIYMFLVKSNLSRGYQ